MKNELFDTSQLKPDIRKKWQNLLHLLSGLDRAAVAFSGGIDSSLLCVAAYHVMRENMVAFTINSPINNSDDIKMAESITCQFGIPHKIFNFNDLEQEKFVENPVDRCYYCKLRRFEYLLDMAGRTGFNILLDGSNVDDQSDYRPGIQAVNDLHIASPLAECSMGKEEIRTLAEAIGLENWNRPSQPYC